jgi:anti-sigma factor RsiW
MASCSDLIALLSDYVDGRLSPHARADLDAHLATCPECVAFVQTFRSTISLLQSLTDEDLPAEVRLRLQAFLDSHARS